MLLSAAPSNGLYFTFNGKILSPGDSVLITGIGPQPANRNNSGSTLVCVTTNVNTACCRKNDNNGETTAAAGAVGEWYYPNGTQVPRPDGNVVDFARIGFTHRVRLAREKGTPPLGVYTCEVPEPGGVNVTANITLMEQGMRYV